MDNITERRRHFPDRTRRVPACYDRDLYSWAVEQAALLRAGRIIEADAGNIAEELDDVGTNSTTNWSRLCGFHFPRDARFPGSS
jgi:hypothetical protein